jgi:hypothetical protein
VKLDVKTTPRRRSVMLSKALQRNAKHEARLSNISDYRLAEVER